MLCKKTGNFPVLWSFNSPWVNNLCFMEEMYNWVIICSFCATFIYTQKRKLFSLYIFSNLATTYDQLIYWEYNALMNGYWLLITNLSIFCLVSMIWCWRQQIQEDNLNIPHPSTSQARENTQSLKQILGLSWCILPVGCV